MAEDLPDAPWASGGNELPDAPWATAMPPEAADHGLSERQQLSPLQKAINPITSYPETYQRMNQEARDQMSRGVNQIANSDSLIDPQAHGISDVLGGAGNVALGGLGYVGSPINAAYRSIVGQPVEDVTGIPREYTETAAQLATPGIGLKAGAASPALVASAAAKAPTIAELRTAAKAGYESPEVKAVQIQGSAAPRLADTIQTNLNHAGIDENIAPKTFGIIGKLNDVPDEAFLTVDNLRSLRRTLGNAAKSIDPTERLAAKSAMEHVDEFLSDLPSRDVIAGDPKAASAILKEANANYSAMSRAAEMDAQLTRAQLRASASNSGMNVGNTIRQRMADILINPKLKRGFTANELDQMRSIVEGTPLNNAARAAGNILGGGGGLGTAIMGLASHGVAPIAGYALRKGVNTATKRAAGKINEAVRARSPLGQMRSSVPQAGPAADRLPTSVSAGLMLPHQTSNMPMLQGPESVHAEDDQQNIPRPPPQQQDGGRIDQQSPFAKGGPVKITKSAAHYRGGSKAKRCADCTMFRTPNSCTAVRGSISKHGLCDLFERKQQFAAGGRIDPDNIDHAPTEAQKEAGNYAKDHVSVHGLDIAIENAKGHFRRGVDRDGKSWAVRMPAHYGYVKGTVGHDKDHVDVYLGPHLKSPRAYVIDQKDAETGAFDEHKCFLGFASISQVKRTYREAFSDGKADKRMGAIVEMPIDTFKKWIKSEDPKQPVVRHYEAA